MLKLDLAHGELHCVGAITIDEYRKYIEKDVALERCFQKNFISEPNIKNIITILKKLKGNYELHYYVQITNSAIIIAATLSHRYISDRRLPDKDINLINEAFSSIRSRNRFKTDRT